MRTQLYGAGPFLSLAAETDKRAGRLDEQRKIRIEFGKKARAEVIQLASTTQKVMHAKEA